jgi:hypothetical protein
MQQIPLDLHYPQFVAERVALDQQRIELFSDDGDVLHRCL